MRLWQSNRVLFGYIPCGGGPPDWILRGILCYYVAMARLYDTIRFWADGQNALVHCEEAQRARLQVAVAALLTALRQHGSLADLAVAYYADDRWWRRIAEEFALSAEDAVAMRNAAHWQRFMEIRHRRPAPHP